MCDFSTRLESLAAIIVFVMCDLELSPPLIATMSVYARGRRRLHSYVPVHCKQNGTYLTFVFERLVNAFFFDRPQM